MNEPHSVFRIGANQVELDYVDPSTDMLDLLEWHLRGGVAVSFIDLVPSFFITEINITSSTPNHVDVTTYGGTNTYITGPIERRIKVYGTTEEGT